MTAAMKLEEEMQAVDRHAQGKLLSGRIGGVGVVVFNQPEKRNAISLAMWEGLVQALDDMAADDAVRVVLYAGAGGNCFSAGADLSEFAALREGADADALYTAQTRRGREKITAFPKPSIACIQGYCLGGGLYTATQMDLRVSASDAVFGIPAARVGLHYAIEPAAQLVSLVGPARAKMMLYTAHRYSAAEALAMGLVDRVAQGDVVQACLELAHTIAANAPLSVQASKFTIEETLKPPAERDTEALASHTRRCIDSADYREGRTAFAEKRQPTFVGA